MNEKLRRSSSSKEADKDQELLPLTIADRLARVLGEMGQPMHWQDIHSLAETDGLGGINTNSVIGILHVMAHRGMIVGINRGIWSLPEFADKKYEPPRIPIKTRIDAVLRQAGRPLQVQEISLQIKEDGHGELFDKSMGAALHQMTRAEIVIRTSRGFYCLPEFAVEKYEPPEMTLSQWTIATLWQAGRPLHWQEIHQLAETDAPGQINLASLKSCYCRLVHKGIIVRTEWGVYSLPEFSYASDKKLNSYVTKAEILGKVVNILNKIGGSASTEHIYLLLTTGNLKGLSPKKVSDMLNRMAQEDKAKRKIARIAEGTYCLPELADQEYEEPPFKIRDKLLSILQAAGRPLHCYEMYQFAEEGEYGAIKHGNIPTILTQLTQEGLTVRVVRGVYSIPEFADEHYELPKLTLSLRVYFALLEAGRPLHRTEVRRLVNLDSQDEIVLQKIGATLVWMTEKKKAVRLEAGVYSLPEFADKDYESLKPAVNIRLKAVLKEAGQPLHRQEVHQRIEQDGYGLINPRSMRSALQRMVEKKTAVRVKRSFYSLPEFADEQI